tara:strand:- start:103 stop:888 length:786 start_codon:yes stop_codon:yes gene_type:complete
MIGLKAAKRNGIKIIGAIVINDTKLKKDLLDKFDDDYFGSTPADDKKILNKVGKVNVGWNINYLKTLPKVGAIIDVGAADDFPSLHDSMPNTFSFLIDANEKYIEKYEEYLKTKQGDYYIGAVGEHEKTVQYTHYVDKPYLSTIESRQDSLDSRVELIDLQMKKLDQIVPFDKCENGVLLKIDIEGSEIPALKGASKLLEKTKVVICECSLDAEFPGGENFTEIFNILLQKGFKLKDIIRAPRLHHNTYPAQIIDAVFEKK